MKATVPDISDMVSLSSVAFGGTCPDLPGLVRL